MTMSMKLVIASLAVAAIGVHSGSAQTTQPQPQRVWQAPNICSYFVSDGRQWCTTQRAPINGPAGPTEMMGCFPLHNGWMQGANVAEELNQRCGG